MTRGAGGFSISLSLIFSPVVPSTAPVFVFLNIRFTEHTTANDMHEAYNIRLQQLSRLYSERKASPHDTDPDGNTVLYVGNPLPCIVLLLIVTQKACKIFEHEYGIYGLRLDMGIIEAYFQFLKGLRELGVPLNRSNVESR